MDERSQINKAGIPPQPSVWLHVGSGIAIAIAVLFFFMCIYMLVDLTEVSPGAFMGACTFGPIGLVFAYLQYRAVYCGRQDPAMFNGIGLILFAALMLFNVVVIAYEMLVDYEDSQGKLGFAIVLISIFLLLGVLSLCLSISTIRFSRRFFEYEKAEPLCACGYSLRGTIASGGSLCPECGQAVKKG